MQAGSEPGLSTTRSPPGSWGLRLSTPSPSCLSLYPFGEDTPVPCIVRLQFSDSDFCAFALTGSVLSPDGSSCSGSRNSAELPDGDCGPQERGAVH